MLTIIILVLSSIAAVALLTRTMNALRRYRYVPVTKKVDELPTVSVCIAARNETHALARCLEKVLNSDYKKLEVLVLDDSSDDGTSLIIKSFAQAGVRFIAGSSLPNGWLGKNHAYQTLIDESSGDYVLFLDVDTVIAPSTISQLVEQLMASGNTMLSVLPRRDDTYRFSALFGTMRYYWELLLGTANRPPAASALWMVQRTALAALDVGLVNYGLSVRPERHLARQLQRSGSYQYITGARSLGISYEKKLHSQYETAIRLYYPLTGRTVLLWFCCSVYLGLLIVPVTIVASSRQLWVGLWAVSVMVVCTISFGLFVRRSYGGKLMLLRVLLGPLLVIQEFILLCLSYWQYRRGAVTWKGRSVTAGPMRHDALSIDE